MGEAPRRPPAMSQDDTSSTVTVNEDTSEPTTEGERAGGKLFGGMTPQEAGRLSAERRAARKRAEKDAEERAVGGDEYVVIRVPVNRSAIVRALEKDAKRGSATAARELRAWLSEYPRDDGDFELASMEREQRRLFAQWLAEGLPEGQDAISWVPPPTPTPPNDEPLAPVESPGAAQTPRETPDAPLEATDQT